MERKWIGWIRHKTGLYIAYNCETNNGKHNLVLGYTSIFIVPSWNMMRRSREYIWLNGHRKTRHSKIQLSNQNIFFNAITLNCEQKALRQVLLSFFILYIFHCQYNCPNGYWLIECSKVLVCFSKIDTLSYLFTDSILMIIYNDIIYRLYNNI